MKEYLVSLKLQKKITSVFMGLMLLFLTVSQALVQLPIEVKATTIESTTENKYVAIGDSISYGMSATNNKGYVDLFYNYIKAKDGNKNLVKYNLSVPGKTSSELLEDIQTSEYQEKIKNAKFIIISVGGNNLLRPIIKNICSAFGVVYENNDNYPEELAKAIASNSNKDAIIASLVASAASNEELKNGIVQYASDLPKIITIINQLSPNGKVYISNIYNPCSSDDGMYSIMDNLVRQLNTVISAGASVGGDTIVNVYDKFKNTTGAVNFNLSKSLIDPHPTDVGHAAIYELLIDLYKSTSNVNLKSLSITGGKLNSKFNPDTTEYSAAIGSKTNEVKIKAEGYTGCTITVNGAEKTNKTNLYSLDTSSGDKYTVTIIVTGNDSTKKTYTIDFVKTISSNADLKSLKIVGGKLSPNFNANTAEYNVKIYNTAKTVKITPAVADTTATLEVTGAVQSKNKKYYTVDTTSEGDKEVTIAITAQDSSKKIYTIKITKN